MKVCPTSCNLEVCKDTVCADKNTTACTIWGLNDECLKNPAMMLAECPVTCGVCTEVCQDKDPSCADWAIDGQCDSNEEAMLTLCPQSCGVCQQLEKFYHGGNGLKDEL